jgi:L-ribulose-5-phosphate 4-epimerase
MKIDQMKESVLNMAKKSFEEKLFAGTGGNLSLRCQGTNYMAITPSTVDYSLMKQEDIIVMKLDGEIIQGSLPPSSEWQMHAEVYKERDDVYGIVHTHSPCASGFAVAHERIPVILYEMLYFLHGDIAIVSPQIPGTPEVGIYALEALENRRACLLGNHVVLAIGSTIEEAHDCAIYVEDAAIICLKAGRAGEIYEIPDEEQKQILKNMGLVEN